MLEPPRAEVVALADSGVAGREGRGGKGGRGGGVRECGIHRSTGGGPEANGKGGCSLFVHIYIYIYIIFFVGFDICIVIIMPFIAYMHTFIHTNIQTCLHIVHTYRQGCSRLLVQVPTEGSQ